MMLLFLFQYVVFVLAFSTKQGRCQSALLTRKDGPVDTQSGEKDAQFFPSQDLFMRHLNLLSSSDFLFHVARFYRRVASSQRRPVPLWSGDHVRIARTRYENGLSEDLFLWHILYITLIAKC